MTPLFDPQGSAIARGDIEVSVRESATKAVIEGKTAVPFQSFVKLVLQRKVQALFKDWQNEPIVVSSSLLSTLANSPADSREDRGRLVLTSIVIGTCFGVFLTSLALLVLILLEVDVGPRELLTVVVVLFLLALLLQAAEKLNIDAYKQAVVDKVERIADVISRKG